MKTVKDFLNSTHTIPNDCESVRASLLYEYYYKDVFPESFTYKQAEVAIEKMIADETMDPKVYEHVASNIGFGKRHDKRNTAGSDLLFDDEIEREVKKAFARSDRPESYKINKLSGKIGADIIAFIVEKEYVVLYFFPYDVWRRHMTNDGIINFTPFSLTNPWYDRYGKIYKLNK